jgi:hypothetical protein
MGGMIDDESTIDLARLRERLWRVFAGYPRHLRPGAAAAGKDEALKRLHKIRLADLGPSDAALVLSSYCGDAPALKHFLPRLLDLSVAPGGQGPHYADIRAALQRQDFASWPAEERQIVDLFAAANGLRPRPGDAG